MWLAEDIGAPTIDYPQGTSFSFDYTRTRPWDWPHMIAQLHEGSMRVVAEVSRGFSHGTMA